MLAGVLLLQVLLAAVVSGVRILRGGAEDGVEPLLFWPLAWARQAAWMLLVFSALWLASCCSSVLFETLFPSMDKTLCLAALFFSLGAAFTGAAAWAVEAAVVAALGGNAGKEGLD